MIKGMQVGAELEVPDIDSRIKLPAGTGEYDFKDKTICNSNGTANDPLKKLNKFGSEMNTVPAPDPEALAAITQTIYRNFERKQGIELVGNFSTNTHIHISVPGLADNVKKLKRLAKYIREQEPDIFELVDGKVPDPREEKWKSNAAFQGAWRRYKRRFRSHRAIVSEDVFQKMMAATTPEQFRDAHYYFSKAGKPQLHLLLRAGFNMASLWKHGTIEHRFFTLSPNVKLMYNAFRFCWHLVQDGLEDQIGVRQIIKEHKLTFQPYFPYNYEQDVLFQLTSFMNHKRSKIKDTYHRLIDNGTLTKKDLGWL